MSIIRSFYQLFVNLTVRGSGSILLALLVIGGVGQFSSLLALLLLIALFNARAQSTTDGKPTDQRQRSDDDLVDARQAPSHVAPNDISVQYDSRPS